ncbi:hypothetical protein FCK90_00685 [Kocuria coralli]|uniref:Cobalamin-independent methionine synthase MetE C-terminal/archaeal domain-containing protein n=1 Tax=Kocuria coralli TaxID=1461025 RepID=A0A5J5L1Z3_9MICC|nr:hypothetical protein [Kocuria coralli]KAA9395578.1 hypothetical protein FCK90_00685 [Kocuria coralli]
MNRARHDPAGRGDLPDRDGDGETTRATVLAGLPGEDMVEAITVLRGELGAPHRSVLPILAARSDVAHPIPRTVSVLTDLWCDLQPHGWRLTRHDGKEARAAGSLVAGDVNALADVVGAESDGDREPVTVTLLGPVSLAAGLHLHNGEKALLDAGARRDLAVSLADGLRAHLEAVGTAVENRPVILRLEEPQLQRALDGTIPTASGYRTLRALPRSEADGVLHEVARAARDAGAAGVELVLPEDSDPREYGDGTFDLLYLERPGRPAAEWEPLAVVVERGVRVGLLLGELNAEPGRNRASTGELVEAIVRPWTELGLAKGLLSHQMVAPARGLESRTPAMVRRALARATDLAHGLHQSAQDS